MHGVARRALVEVPNLPIPSAAIQRLLLGEGRSRFRRPPLSQIRLLLREWPLRSVPEPAANAFVEEKRLPPRRPGRTRYYSVALDTGRRACRTLSWRLAGCEFPRSPPKRF